MSHGMLAAMLVVCFIILLSTGWFDKVIDGMQIKRSYAMALALGYLVMSRMWLPMPSFNIAINAGGILIPLLIMLWIDVVLLDRSQIGDTISAGVLIASLLLLVHEIFPKDPRLFVLDHFMTYVGLLALASMITAKKKSDAPSTVYPKMLATAIVSLLLLDTMSVFFIPREYYGYLGDGYTSDLLFVVMPVIYVLYSIADIPLLRKKFVVFHKD